MAPKPELNAVIYALYHLRDLDDVRRNEYAYNVYHKFVHEFDNELQQRHQARIFTASVTAPQGRYSIDLEAMTAVLTSRCCSY